MHTARPKSLRISHVGLRGVVGGGLTASHVLDFASAFGTFLPPGRPVLLGRDPRASGRMLREGVIAGLLASGHEVTDLGIVSTPVIQQAIRRLDAAGGVSIGASHNAAEWNALKFFGPRGTYLSTPEAGELLDIYHLRNFRRADWQSVGRLRFDDSAIDHYLDSLAEVFDLRSLQNFRVVVDCCNGTSGLLLARMNERFQTPFTLINQQPRGRAFAHEPAIDAQTVSLQLAPLIQPLQADAGFLFDVDSDRVAFAAENGQPVSEELVLPLMAEYLLPKGPGKLVITNLSTTALVEEVAARHGGRVVRVPVGRQAAIDALGTYKADQIALAGEGTGAIMMPQFRFVYDGIASMLALLCLMRERGQSLTQLVQNFPSYVLLKGHLPLRTHRLPALFHELGKRYADGKIDRRDGLRVDWPDRWFHVRASQTEPIVRVICEQRGDAPRALFGQLMEEVQTFA